jgi:hypothetical protein
VPFLLKSWYDVLLTRKVADVNFLLLLTIKALKDITKFISSRTMALGSTQPLTEMSTRNLPGDKGWPESKADNLTAICEPIVWKMWEPRRLTILWALTACYRDRFTLSFCFVPLPASTVAKREKATFKYRSRGFSCNLKPLPNIS